LLMIAGRFAGTAPGAMVMSVSSASDAGAMQSSSAHTSQAQRERDSSQT
jgi:hypothetical protein